MTITRCISSHLMTELLSWGKRKQDEFAEVPQITWCDTARRLTAKVGLVVLMVTAVIETVAYTALRVLVMWNEKTADFFGRCFDSSTWTIKWSFNALFSTT